MPFPPNATSIIASGCDFKDGRLRARDIPPGLVHLNLSFCNLKSLPRLPATLRTLDVSCTNLDSVENLPDGLAWLSVAGVDPCNWLWLPMNLAHLDISYCDRHLVTELFLEGLEV